MAEKKAKSPKVKPPKARLNYEALREIYQNKIRAINNVYVNTEVTLTALRAFSEKVEKDPHCSNGIYETVAPSTRANKTVTIRRKADKIKEIIGESVEFRAHGEAIAFLVAHVEDFLQLVVRLILTAYPKRILTSIKGNEGAKSLSLSDVLDAGDLREIIVAHANQRAREALYAQPAQYLAYLNKILTADISESVFSKYIEVKATRDLVVHNSRIVNGVYIEKAGSLARAAVGQTIPTNDAYFADSVGASKQLLSDIYRSADPEIWRQR